MFLVRYQMDFLARLMVRTQINRQKYKGNQDKKNVHRIGFPFLLLLLPLSTTTPELLIVMWIQFQFQFRVFIFIINVSLIPMSAKCSCFWKLRLCEWHFMGAYAFLHNFERCQSVVCNWFDDVFVSVSARQSTANTILRQALLCSLSHFGHLIVFVFVFDIRIWTLDIISLAFEHSDWLACQPFSPLFNRGIVWTVDVSLNELSRACMRYAVYTIEIKAGALWRFSTIFHSDIFNGFFSFWNGSTSNKWRATNTQYTRK